MLSVMLVMFAALTLVGAATAYLGRIYREGRDYELDPYRSGALQAGQTRAQIEAQADAHMRTRHPRLSRVLRYR